MVVLVRWLFCFCWCFESVCSFGYLVPLFILIIWFHLAISVLLLFWLIGLFDSFESLIYLSPVVLLVLWCFDTFWCLVHLVIFVRWLFGGCRLVGPFGYFGVSVPLFMLVRGFLWFF